VSQEVRPHHSYNCGELEKVTIGLIDLQGVSEPVAVLVTRFLGKARVQGDRA